LAKHKIVEVKLLNGREEVKDSAWATMGVLTDKRTPLTDETWEAMLIDTHSPVEEFRISVKALVHERVHTHLVRHKEIGKYVASWRPDKGAIVPNDGKRPLKITMNAKRMVEVFRDRLCGESWEDTISLFEDIRDRLWGLDSVLPCYLSPKCNWLGFCPTGKVCTKYLQERDFFIEAEKRMINRKNKMKG